MTKNNPICLPNYENGILSVISSVLHHYGIQSDQKTDELTDLYLAKQFKNVVLFVCDGMGVNILEKTLSTSGFLRQHCQKSLTTVFPSSTVPATTSIYSGLSPISHAWMGWAGYVAEEDKILDLFTGNDTYTGEASKIKSFSDVNPYTHIATRIAQNCENVKTSIILPHKIAHNGIKTLHKLTTEILDKTRQEGRQFVVAYWPDPDHTEHYFGPDSAEAITQLRVINRRIKRLAQLAKDTLFIVMADHGLIQINQNIDVKDCGEMVSCFYRPMGLEVRCCSVYVKPEKKDLFEQEFQKYLAEDFLLISREEALKSNLFGFGNKHERIDEMLGEYLIVAISDKVLFQEYEDGLSYPRFKGMHGGITQEEMLVPLIIIPCE